LTRRHRREEARLPTGFVRLLISWFAAQSADGMRFAALPLLAYFTDRSPAAVAGVAAATSLPWLLIALPAGLIVDRLNPAKVIAWANLARAVAAILVVLAIWTGSVSIVVLGAIGFGLTAAETFTDSAAQSLLVQMVPTEQLERANARFISCENVGFDLIGPLSAGALFTIAKWAPFVVSALAFAIAAAVIVVLGRVTWDPFAGGDLAGPSLDTVDNLSSDKPSLDTVDNLSSDKRSVDTVDDLSAGTLSVPTHSVDITDSAGRQAARTSIRGAFAAVFADPVLRSLVITVAVLAAAVAAMEGVLVIYATGPLGLPSALFPTLLASYSVGLLSSAPLLPRVVGKFGSGVVMLSVIGVTAVTLLVLGAFPHRAVAWACFLVMGAALGFWNILSATRRQRRTPRGITAAVSSAFRTIAWGAVPLGAALGGAAAQHWGVTRVFFVAGVVVLALAVLMGRQLLRPVVAVEAAVPDVGVDSEFVDEGAPPASVSIEHGLAE
jgi:predicted MFS family arabinose efflux permease